MVEINFSSSSDFDFVFKSLHDVTMSLQCLDEGTGASLCKTDKLPAAEVLLRVPEVFVEGSLVKTSQQILVWFTLLG